MAIITYIFNEVSIDNRDEYIPLCQRLHRIAHGLDRADTDIRSIKAYALRGEDNLRIAIETYNPDKVEEEISKHFPDKSYIKRDGENYSPL